MDIRASAETRWPSTHFKDYLHSSCVINKTQTTVFNFLSKASHSLDKPLYRSTTFKIQLSIDRSAPRKKLIYKLQNISPF